MRTSDIPADFPVLSGGAVPGAQPKLLVSLGEDGIFRVPGNSPQERLERYEECMRIVEWAIPFLSEKLQKPKYASMPHEQILARFQNTLRKDFQLEEEDQVWVRKKVAQCMGWIADPGTATGTLGHYRSTT